MAYRKTLFDALVDENRLHPSFVAMRDSPRSDAARWMVDDVYQTFEDRDGNFLEQFQTTGFDSRFLELYLHAYFERSGILVPTQEAVPDFFVTGGAQYSRIAVEATTVNPSESGVLAELGRTIADLSEAELRAYRRHELAIRYGSPLYSKLQKRYWELPQCSEVPLVFAIQAFHDQDALGLSDSALTSYLFGLESSHARAVDGSLAIEFNRIESHRVGDKEIPSSFFSQPNAEHVSAVLFTNSGTHGKFTRMGYQSGAANDRLSVLRRGHALNESPYATDPVFFFYSLDNPPLIEPWGQGTVVIHNPRALLPLPLEAFPNAAHAVLEEDGAVHHYYSSWHVFTSHTITIDLGEAREASKLPVRLPQIGIGQIPESEARHLAGDPELGADVEETSWYTDESEFFVGAVFATPAEETWGFNLFGRDEFFRFRSVERKRGLSDRRAALDGLYDVFVEYLMRPQRIFSNNAGAGEIPG
jgi:hypothetical protein